MISIRRAIGGGLFGLAYGGGLVNGVNTGLGYVSQSSEYSVGHTPYLGLVVYWLSTVLMGLLAGYVGRSIIAGGIAAAIGGVLLVAAPRMFFFEAIPRFTILLTAAATAVAAGTAVAAWGHRFKVEPQDMDFGRVLGVSWKHWLWLWLPWQYVISNIIWLGTPRFILIGGPWGAAITDIVKSAIGVCAVTYAGYMALRILRAEAKITRRQSAVQFVGRFLVVPILVNLWRFFL